MPDREVKGDGWQSQPGNQSVSHSPHSHEQKSHKERKGGKEGRRKLFRGGGREGRGNERGMSLSMSLCLMHSVPMRKSAGEEATVWGPKHETWVTRTAQGWGKKRKSPGLSESHDSVWLRGIFASKL